MKQFLIVFLLIPLFVFSQTQPKPKTGTPAKKTTTAAKKPAAAGTKKPATTATKKPGAVAPKKPNPQVVKLVEKAYLLYNEAKDAECEKVIKQILALDPKNKDAFLLRANIAMFAFKYDDMWVNLNKVYKFYPGEPEVYSTFAMTHLNYYFLNDSAKRVMCRKTIRLASNQAEGYAALGMVAAVGGFYDEALSCFDIAYRKTWKDTLSRVVLDLPYANCLYSVGDTIGAIARLDRIIPRMTAGKDRYTCIYLRAKYKLDMNNTDVAADIDTLNVYAPGQGEVSMLNVKYLSKTNRRDSACKVAKSIRLIEGGESFDMSPYCDDLIKSVDMSNVRKFTYFDNGNELELQIKQFAYPQTVDFTWKKTEGAKIENGRTRIIKTGLDSAYTIFTDFNADADIILNKTSGFWMSNMMMKDIAKDSTSTINVMGQGLGKYRFAGHEQVEVFDKDNNEVLIDCIVLFDGETKICYINDTINPLIVKIEAEKYNFQLTKFE
ncbi:MAG TPA: hypothetical protein VGF79_01510 [Bacteroidia bacterium]